MNRRQLMATLGAAAGVAAVGQPAAASGEFFGTALAIVALTLAGRTLWRWVRGGTAEGNGEE